MLAQLPVLECPATKSKSADEIRDLQRALWTTAAAGRESYQLLTARRSSITEKLIASAQIVESMSVLDIACGTGDPSIDIARIIGSSGQVLGLDITPVMVFIASQIASQAMLSNVSFKVIQSELELGIVPESFDAITSRFGLMFMPDPMAAIDTWVRILRTGGRIALCTHAALPSFEMTMAIIEHQAPALADSFDWRRVLSLSSTTLLERLFLQAGLKDIEIKREQQSHVHGSSVSECWDAMIQRSPISRGLRSLPNEEKRTIRESCIRALSINSSLGLDATFGGTVIFASGRK